MSDKHIKLTRRRAIGGLITIGGAAAAAGAGTFALFSDTESGSASLSAGTLDLSTSDSLSFSASDLKPTDSDVFSASLEKSGSVAGDLAIDVTNVESTDGSGGTGVLDDQIELTLWIDGDQSGTGSADSNDHGLNSDGTWSSGDKGDSAYAVEYDSTTWDTSDSGSPALIEDFSGGVDFVLEYEFIDDQDDSNIDNNAAQGHDLTVDFEFTLTQQ